MAAAGDTIHNEEAYTMAEQETLFERLARERGITVEEMRAIISAV